MQGKRKTPAACTCRTCGLSFESWGNRGSLYCPSCRAQRDRERKRAWEERHKEARRNDPELRRKEAEKSRLYRASEHGRAVIQARRERQRNDPERVAEYRRRRREMYAENPEKYRERARRWRRENPETVKAGKDRYRNRPENRERIREARREYEKTPQRIAYNKRRRESLSIRNRAMKSGSVDRAVSLLAENNLLQECPRLHVRQLRLPCGQRNECFGVERCPMCPATAKPPTYNWLQETMVAM